MTRRALITGALAQDGIYLTRLLKAKGYEVHGLQRRASASGSLPVAGADPGRAESEGVLLHLGDLTDSTRLVRLVERVAPDEIYNLAAQSDVAASFGTAEFTTNADALGTLRLLEAIRILKKRDLRYYQAGSSELFGLASEAPQTEKTPFHPRSPYGVAKLYAYWITVNYREAYGLHASNGILYNHEGPYRGEAFVTRKITRGVAAIELGLEERLTLGNLDARRDWGHARDYVEGMWLMLQQERADDYVLATGETHSVRDFVTQAFAHVGRVVEWRGSGVEETGVDRATGATLVAVDPR